MRSQGSCFDVSLSLALSRLPSSRRCVIVLSVAPYSLTLLEHFQAIPLCNTVSEYSTEYTPKCMLHVLPWALVFFFSFLFFFKWSEATLLNIVAHFPWPHTDWLMAGRARKSKFIFIIQYFYHYQCFREFDYSSWSTQSPNATFQGQLRLPDSPQENETTGLRPHIWEVGLMTPPTPLKSHQGLSIKGKVGLLKRMGRLVSHSPFWPEDPPLLRLSSPALTPRSSLQLQPCWGFGR